MVIILIVSPECFGFCDILGISLNYGCHQGATPSITSKHPLCHRQSGCLLIIVFVDDVFSLH
ncbi:MAG: hypothetical protein RSB02_06965, partial [Anaerovoracaceae bacterium]